MTRPTVRLFAATATAAAVVLLVLSLAGAAAAAIPVQLTATVSPATVVYPAMPSITGSVADYGGPLEGVEVFLLERPAGADDYAPAASGTTGSGGSYSLTPAVAPSVSTDYRVAFAADGVHAAAEADVRLAVRPSVTFRAAASLWLGGAVTLRGSVSPARPGAQVVIDRRVDGVWQPLLSATLDAGSRYRLAWTPAEFGYYRLRARVDADDGHDTGLSAWRRVTVNRPNAHRVPMRYAHYIVIVRHEYRLYYYEHGVLVRRFDVALGRPGYRTPLGYFRIYGKRKPAGGALGACAMFYRRKGGIAIHGTNEPWLIRRPAPRPFSHGCARMFNRQVLWLYARVPVGTHVHNLR
jgi:lipoprotein-anchoring transpeptidase ErfK/SrfK